jgi:hypothetical protein
MKISLSKSGGFASFPGLSRPVVTDTAQLDPRLSQQLEALVQDAGFFDRPASVDTTARGAADYFTYTLTVEDGSRVHTVRLTEPITDASLKRLVDSLQKGQRHV